MCFVLDNCPSFQATIAYHQDVKKPGQLSLLYQGLSVHFLTPKSLAVIKLPPPDQPTVGDASSYSNLECTAEDVQKITRLISVMGENGKLTLLVKYQKELRQIGREIEHVHPLKFLGTIFSNPYLKKCMKEIHSDYFKWTNFIEGLADGLTVQSKQGKVLPFLDDFAKTVGVTSESLKGYVDRNDWENMAIYIINN